MDSSAILGLLLFSFCRLDFCSTCSTTTSTKALSLLKMLGWEILEDVLSLFAILLFIFCIVNFFCGVIRDLIESYKFTGYEGWVDDRYSVSFPFTYHILITLFRKIRLITVRCCYLLYSRHLLNWLRRNFIFFFCDWAMKDVEMYRRNVNFFFCDLTMKDVERCRGVVMFLGIVHYF